jgi:hypothetical protein
MKRQILLTAFVALSTFAIAQSPSFGIRAGISSSAMSGDAVSSLNDLVDYTGGAITTGGRTGFFAGGNVSIPLGGQVSLEPGLYYSQKGYEMKGELNIKGAGFLGANAKAQLNTHYIDVPVVLKANFSGFEVFAGPQVSYLAQADLRTRAGVLGFNLLNKTMDATGQLNRWDAAITGGVGYRFTNGVSLSASYDHGLSRTDANQNFEAYNRSFKVGVGYNF